MMACRFAARLRRTPRALLFTLAMLASPAILAANPVTGGALYNQNCMACHGDLTAGPGFDNVDNGANNPALITNTILNNVPMQSLIGQFTASQIEDIAAYIGNPAGATAPVGALLPAVLPFNNAAIGIPPAQLVTTLRNTGTNPLIISGWTFGGPAAGDYSKTGGTCTMGASLPANASCTFTLRFSPTATGSRDATFTVSHNGLVPSSVVSLLGLGTAVMQPGLTLSAGLVDFGPILVNAPSVTRTIAVTNSGQAALLLNSIALTGANAADVTVNGTCAQGLSISPGSSCEFTVFAHPGAVGNFSAALRLTTNAANGSNGALSIALQGAGAGPSPSAVVNRDALAFGFHSIGVPAAEQRLTLTNNGNVPLTYSLAFTGSGAFGLAPGGSCSSGSLAVGASCSILVRFAPVVAGAASASLAIATNGNAIAVPLTGSGSSGAQAMPVLSGTDLVAFADTAVGAISAANTATLTNSGNAGLTITSITPTGTDATSFQIGGTCTAGMALGAGSSCIIESRFAPAVAGTRKATLVLVTSNGTTLARDFYANGTVPAGAQLLAAQPAALDFGGVVTGHAAASRSIILTNNGSSVIVLQQVALTGPFTALATGCMALPLSLQPGQSCEIKLSYVTPAAPGSSIGAVLVTADDGDIHLTVPLEGKVTPAISNAGGGGCSAIRNGSDPLLPAMLVTAFVVLLWRRRQARKNRQQA